MSKFFYKSEKVAQNAADRLNSKQSKADKYINVVKPAEYRGEKGFTIEFSLKPEEKQEEKKEEKIINNIKDILIIFLYLKYGVKQMVEARKNITWDNAFDYLMIVETGDVNKTGKVLPELETRYYDPVKTPEHFKNYGKSKAWRVINGIDEEYNADFINKYWNEAQFVKNLPTYNPRYQGVLAVVKQYYYNKYWIPSGANNYPSPKNLLVFDAFVQGQKSFVELNDPSKIIQARINSYNQNSQYWNREGWITTRMRILSEFIGADKQQISFDWIDGKGNINKYIA